MYSKRGNDTGLGGSHNILYLGANMDINGNPIYAQNGALVALNAGTVGVEGVYPFQVYVTEGSISSNMAIAADNAGNVYLGSQTIYFGNNTSSLSNAGLVINGYQIIDNNKNLSVQGLNAFTTKVQASVKFYADKGIQVASTQGIVSGSQGITSPGLITASGGINVSGAQPAAAQGVIYYDATQKKFYGYQGAGTQGWVALA
jgi:hypothetical protein